MKESELSREKKAFLNFYRYMQDRGDIAKPDNRVLEVASIGKEIAQQLDPEVKKIDMYRFIGSQVLMKFEDEKGNWCNTLKVPPECFDCSVTPKLNYVNAWLGGECPLPEGLEIRIHLRSSLSRIETDYMGLRWKHNKTCDDIIAFEILGLADGWEW